MLLSHEQVAEAVVVGVADDKWGELVGAIVRMKPKGPTQDTNSLLAWCKQHLGHEKLPRRWLLVGGVVCVWPWGGSLLRE